MSKALPSEGKFFPRGAPRGASTLDRLAAFRVTYAALFAFLLLYVFTVKGVEQLLQDHYRQAVAEAVRVEDVDARVLERMRTRLDRAVRGSAWVRIGGVRVTAIVIGADGITPLYLGRALPPPPPPPDPLAAAAEAERLLPATADVSVSVPHNSLLANAILVSYAALLVVSLFAYNRRLARREEEQLAAAVAEREAAAARAARIERELADVQHRLETQQATTDGSEEIRTLRAERARLQEELDAVGRREQELAARAGRAQTLDEERQALEELLDEATRDLTGKDEAIRSLEQRLRRATKAQPTARAGKEEEQLERRLRTLYKNLEIDDRVVRDLVALRDETMKLKAEESLKRLSDDTETAAVRRKVGGLPPHLSIFELGFAGKGRIYYTRGRQRRFRVLAVGAKNTQKTDLEYLSRLPRDG